MVPGAQYTKAFKGYRNRDGEFIRWDGKVKLLEDNATFPFGLKDRVADFYRSAGRELILQDNRVARIPAVVKDLSEPLKRLNKSPFPYQLEALSAAEDNDCGIIKISTGGGKTLVAALMTARFNKRTIVYVVGKELLYQFHELFSSLFDQPIGLVGDGNCSIHDINIVSVWSVGQVFDVEDAVVDDDGGEEASPKQEDYRKIKELVETADIHIFDECHLCACGTIQEISKVIHPERIYGMSASPWRDDNADLLIEAVLGKRIYEIDSSFLIDNGFLVRPHIHFLHPDRMPKFSDYKSAYSQYIINNQQRNNMVLDEAERMVGEGRQTLILFSTIQHGKALFSSIKKRMPAIFISGNSSKEERAEVKNKIANKEINCIVASRVYDMGIDVPSLSGLVLAGGGKSSVRALQRIGRVIRRHPGKESAEVIDFIDSATYLKEHSSARLKIYGMEKGFKLYDGSNT